MNVSRQEFIDIVLFEKKLSVIKFGHNVKVFLRNLNILIFSIKDNQNIHSKSHPSFPITNK